MEKNKNLPKHVAIILDGNGRWAKARGLSRSLGHYAGGQNLVEIAKHANKIGLKQLSVYCFSTENWQRSADEVEYLMTKPVEMLRQNLPKIIDSNIKILHAGALDNIPKEFKECLEDVVDKTAGNTGLKLVLCIDYGAKAEIVQSAKKSKEIDDKSISDHLSIPEDVDLLIRTGGELRLSNFMLWQIAYAELYFSKKMWPAFRPKDLDKALNEYQKRNRRFGKV